MEDVKIKGAVLLCAGGAFQFRGNRLDIIPVAIELNKLGYQCFVLDYRLRPHMPADHKSYLEWDGQRFRHWAGKIGPKTESVVKSILKSKAIERQSYRSCFGLLKLADKYSESRLEAACSKALELEAPVYSVIKNILESGRDLPEKIPAVQMTVVKIHRNVRGNDYYTSQAREMQIKQPRYESVGRNQEEINPC